MEKEEGFTTVISCFVILIGLALCGLLIDTGVIFASKTQLDHATEVAASKAVLEAYSEDIYRTTNTYCIDKNLATIESMKYLAINYPTAKVENIVVPENEQNAMILTTTAEISTHFMTIFGIKKVNIKSNVKGFVFD